ncbi:hypothetical protein PYCCODRAFT_1356822 [Trametes coccinea BRFM310]|uniref:Uncharacterized protein n=1 Tax=Trametes coccinea (strain BRFM310) TaxID=1353009 RepID=A0A1Y2J5N9_TRAC3|nr:hypothetical protein PYCCODRAFT_1356822 [Trametes coccinea BRFM310]
MLDDLERLLAAKGIPFHRTGNRIRCFPHVVNISVQRSLRALDPTDPSFDAYDPDIEGDLNAALSSDPDYADALLQNPIKAARTLIQKARQSGQRREEFERIVADCVRNGTFGEGLEPGGTQLLRDVDTRWSSTFLMIDRLLSLYPAVQLLMSKHDPDALLSDKTLDVLSDIREFLAIPHAVQELLSAENTPTASLALPAYAELIDILKGAQEKLPRIRHGIQAAISALEEYMAYTRQTRVYALAMGKYSYTTVFNGCSFDDI